MNSAYMFYCHDDETMNFIADDESRIEVAGISADQMFNTIGNAICSEASILKVIKSLRPHQIERTQEMIDKLQSLLDKHNNND